MKNKTKKPLFFLLLVMMTGMLGCQIVEPEKRAYPLAVGIDRQEDGYRIYLAMAQLAKSTGQGKEGGEEQQGDGEGTLFFTGASKEEIQEIYGKTRELYLDPGHVQAVIFGEGMMRDEQQMKQVLLKMEGETALGNSAYVFGAYDLEEVLEQNGTRTESLGAFLSGLYENRTSQGNPVTLSELYREIHNRGRVLKIPWITVKENQMIVDKTEE